MLTREDMLNGAFVRAHETLLPAHMRWDAEKYGHQCTPLWRSARWALLCGYLPTGH